MKRLENAEDRLYRKTREQEGRRFFHFFQLKTSRMEEDRTHFYLDEWTNIKWTKVGGDQQNDEETGHTFRCLSKTGRKKRGKYRQQPTSASAIFLGLSLSGVRHDLY